MVSAGRTILGDMRSGDVRISRILTQATRAFDQHGFDLANVEDIAINAGVGKSTIYRIFGSKMGLFLAVVENAVRKSCMSAQVEVPTGKPLEEGLCIFAAAHLRSVYIHVCDISYYHIMRLIIAATNRNPEIAQRYVDIYSKIYMPSFSAFLAAKIDSGEMNDVDINEFADDFFRSIFYNPREIFKNGPTPSAEQIEMRSRERVRRFLYGYLNSR